MTMDKDSVDFIRGFRRISKRVHANSINKGWEENKNELSIIANLHSEVTEFFEALVKGDPADEHCPEFSNAEVEQADIILRVMGNAEAKGYRIAEALIEKMKYNVTRSYRHGNKEY